MNYFFKTSKYLCAGLRPPCSQSLASPLLLSFPDDFQWNAPAVSAQAWYRLHVVFSAGLLCWMSGSDVAPAPLIVSGRLPPPSLLFLALFPFGAERWRQWTSSSCGGELRKRRRWERWMWSFLGFSGPPRVSLWVQLVLFYFILFFFIRTRSGSDAFWSGLEFVAEPNGKLLLLKSLQSAARSGSAEMSSLGSVSVQKCFIFSVWNVRICAECALRWRWMPLSVFGAECLDISQSARQVVAVNPSMWNMKSTLFE